MWLLCGTPFSWRPTKWNFWQASQGIWDLFPFVAIWFADMASGFFVLVLLKILEVGVCPPEYAGMSMCESHMLVGLQHYNNFNIKSLSFHHEILNHLIMVQAYRYCCSVLVPVVVNFEINYNMWQSCKQLVCCLLFFCGWQDLLETVVANWKVWIPFQVVNFGFVPPHLQVPASTLYCFCHILYLSKCLWKQFFRAMKLATYIMHILSIQFSLKGPQGLTLRRNSMLMKLHVNSMMHAGCR